MIMPGRDYNAEKYRFGFNGKENDNEVNKGVGGQQDYGMRIYDPRIGRFNSVDPLFKEFPELSTYQFASNSPIANIDLDGLERASFQIMWNQAGIHSKQDGINVAKEGTKEGLKNIGKQALNFAIFAFPLEELVVIALELKITRPGLTFLKVIKEEKVINEVSSTMPYNLNSTHDISGNASSRVVGDYMRDIKLENKIEPIEVAQINQENYVLDGHHRVEAAKRTNSSVNFNVVPEKEYPAFGYSSKEAIINANANAAPNKLNNKLVNKHANNSKICYKIPAE